MFAVKRQEPILSFNILSRIAPHSAISQTSQEHYIKTFRPFEFSPGREKSCPVSLRTGLLPQKRSRCPFATDWRGRSGGIIV